MAVILPTTRLFSIAFQAYCIITCLISFISLSHFSCPETWLHNAVALNGFGHSGGLGQTGGGTPSPLLDIGSHDDCGMPPMGRAAHKKGLAGNMKFRPLSPFFILLKDFTCGETRLHNAGWFNPMIALGSIQRHAA